MPLYEYECKKCKIVEEIIVPHNSTKIIKCEKGHTMNKQFPTQTSFKLKGNWYKTTKSY